MASTTPPSTEYETPRWIQTDKKSFAASFNSLSVSDTLEQGFHSSRYRTSLYISYLGRLLLTVM